jgi:hypothetical protein
MTAPTVTIRSRIGNATMTEASALQQRSPDIERPYWREPSGERTTFQEVVLGLDAQAAKQVAERHAEAICALARAAAEARLAGEHTHARRLAHAAGRLCEEVAGFWPRDSWKPSP